MLTLDALLFPLPYLLHPFLPSLISTLLLIYITYFPSQTNSTHPAYSPTLATVLYTTRAWNILTILLALARTFHTWLSNIEGLERDGLGAVWHEILAEGKMRPKRMERRVVWQEEVVLVTGGMGGLGKELVRVLGERGCGGVGVVDLVGGGGGEQEGEEEEGKGKGKTKMSWYKCDVGDAKSVEGLRERVGKDVCYEALFFLPSVCLREGLVCWCCWCCISAIQYSLLFAQHRHIAAITTPVRFSALPYCDLSQVVLHEVGGCIIYYFYFYFYSD